MKKLLILFSLLAPLISFGQSTTTSATITDSDGFLWMNGNYTISFVPNPSYPSLGSYQWTGGNLQQNALFQGALSSGGAFSVSLPSTSAITPAGSQWKFTICPNATTGCFAVNSAVNGGSLSLTSLLSAAAVGPRFPTSTSGSGASAFGYGDIEISPIPNPGGQYFNTTTLICRQWNGTSFQACGSGGGGGASSPPVFSVQLAQTGGAFISDPNITINTASHTLTSPQIDAGTIGYAPGGMIDLRSSTCGAVGNFQGLPVSASISSGSNVLTVSSAFFTSANIGMTVVIHGAGPTGNTPVLITTISSITSPTVAVLGANANTTVSGAYIGMGTDDTTAIQTCINAARSQNRGLLIPTPILPNASYLVTAPLNATDSTSLFFMGDTPQSGFNHSTITHAFPASVRANSPVIDFSGSIRSGMVNVTILAPNNDVTNSYAQGGVYIFPAVGGQSPLQFQLFGDLISAGASPGGVACAIIEIDQPTVDNTNCVGPIGLVIGDGPGTSTVTSPFTTAFHGFGDTLCRVDNSQIGGTEDTPLEFTGCQVNQIGGNTYSALLNPPVVGLGFVNGSIISVTASSSADKNFMMANNIRTENQCSFANCPSTTALYFDGANGNSPSIGGVINGELLGHQYTGPAGPPNDYVIGGAAGLDHYEFNIGTNQGTIFGTAVSGATNRLAGLSGSTFRLHNQNSNAVFGTIGGGPFGFFGDEFYSFFTQANIIAGIPANYGITKVCQMNLTDCSFIDSLTGGFNFTGPFNVTGTLSTTSDANIGGNETVAGNAVVAGNLSVSNCIAAGLMQNFAANSNLFTAGTWSTTFGTAPTITAGQGDHCNQTTASQFITTSTPTVYSDISTPLSATTNYIACASARGASGGETFGVGAGGVGPNTGGDYTLTTSFLPYCFSITTTSSTLTRTIDLVFPVTETVYIDSAWIIPGGPGSGAIAARYTPPPPYLPTTTSAITTPTPEIVVGSSVLTVP